MNDLIKPYVRVYEDNNDAFTDLIKKNILESKLKQKKQKMNMKVKVSQFSQVILTL